MKTMAFTINSQNIERAIGIQATFIMEKKLQKVHGLAKEVCLLCILCVLFEPLLRWKCTCVCTTKQMETMAYGINSQNIQQAFGISVTFITEIKP